MRLEDLARGVPGAVLEGNGDVEVGGSAYDSRQVKPRDLFLAVKGINSDGHSFLAGAMSPVVFPVGGAETDNTSGQTTTEAPQGEEWRRRMADAGVRCAGIETASHALVQDRVGACDFDVAAFTSVGHDHMDYHATWEDYLEAKARLIDLAAGGADKGIEKTAVLNRDDPSYERLSRRSISRRWSYGMTTAADLHPLDLSMTAMGSRFRLNTPPPETPAPPALPPPLHPHKPPRPPRPPLP